MQDSISNARDLLIYMQFLYSYEFVKSFKNFDTRKRADGNKLFSLCPLPFAHYSFMSRDSNMISQFYRVFSGSQSIDNSSLLTIEAQHYLH